MRWELGLRTGAAAAASAGAGPTATAMPAVVASEKAFAAREKTLDCVLHLQNLIKEVCFQASSEED